MMKKKKRKRKRKEKQQNALEFKKLKTIAKIESDIKNKWWRKMKNRNRKKLTDEELNNFEFPRFYYE